MDAQETTTTEDKALSPDDDSAVTMVVRKRELTPKALEEKLNSLIRSRRGKLGQLTAKSNDIERLLSNEEEWSPDITTVQRELKAYGEIYQEFVAFNSSVLSYLNETDGDADQSAWFQPKADKCERFITKIEEWIQAALCSNEVTTEDSVSNIASTSTSRTSTSSASGSLGTGSSPDKTKGIRTKRSTA